MAKEAGLISIQYLRAIAAAMVVGVHLILQLERLGYEGPRLHWLIGGVDIFFVISGFVMWLTTSGRQQSPLEFYRRRIRRIVPLYWLLTAFMTLVVLLAPGLVQSARFDAWNILASFLFIPAQNPSTGLMEPLLVPGWTLNYEMFFYLLFGMALLINQQKRLVAFSALLCAIVSLQALHPPNDSILSFYTSSIIFEFVFGMWIAAWYERWSGHPSVIPSYLLLLSGCVAMAVLPTFLSDTPRAFNMGLPGACIVIAALRLEQAGSVPYFSPLMQLGDASYSLYLSHALVLSACFQIWRMLMPLTGSAVSLWVFSLISVLACFVTAVIMYNFVERSFKVHRRP